MRLPCRWQGHAPRFALAMTFLIGWEYLAASSWAVTHRADSATRDGAWPDVLSEGVIEELLDSFSSKRVLLPGGQLRLVGFPHIANDLLIVWREANGAA